MEPKQVQLSLPANLHYSSSVRAFADAVFSAAGFAEAWCSRLELVVDELFMNAVIYGSSESSSLKLSFSYTAEEIEFSMEDEGAGKKKMTAEELKKKVEQNGANHSLTKTSGRGLALITHLWTDRFDIEPSALGGIAIRCRKKIDSSDPPPLPINAFSMASGKQFSFQAPALSAPPDQAGTPAEGGLMVSVPDGMAPAALEDLDIRVQEKIQLLSWGQLLTLDLSAVTYINSTFVGYLSAWYNSVQAKGGQLLLSKLNSRAKDVLNLVGLSQVLMFDN